MTETRTVPYPAQRAPVPRVRLTRRQREVLAFIAAYDTEHLQSPTLQEIANHLCIASIAGVHEHVTALVQAGVLVRQAQVKRSLELTETGLQQLSQADQDRATDAAIADRLARFLAHATPEEQLTIANAAELLGIDLPVDGEDD